MRAIRILIAALALLLFAGQAQAQFVIKRVKCADARLLEFVGFPPVPRHANLSGEDKILSVQIIRDGCRPRGTSAQFYLYEKSYSNIHEFSQMDRDSKYPSSTMKRIQNTRWGIVTFVPPMDAKVSGTFDYMYSWD